MRKLFLMIILALGIGACKKPPVSSQVTYVECQELILDLSDGTMNGVKPNLTQSDIREWIPCYSKFTPNGAEADCGGVIKYTPFHFSYYTYIDKYLVVDSGFKGKGDTVFQKNRIQMRQMLGAPVQNELSSQHPDKDFFTTEFGCIRVHYKDNMPVLIAPHYTICDEINWCQE